MLTGKRFRLTWDTLAIEYAAEKRVFVTVPAGEIIEIIPGARRDNSRTIDILWNGKALVMFAVDVEGRGEPVDG